MPSLAIPVKIPILVPIFPLEIFDHIISLVDKSQLPTTLQVSRAFHRSSSYRRHRSVLLIGLVWDGPSEKIPIHGPLLEYIVDDTLAVGFDEPATFLFDWLRAVPTPPLASTLPHPFTFVTRLFIQAHRWAECDGVPPLNMPNLKTLQVLQDNQPNGSATLDLCCHGGCSIIHNFRPQQVMIGDDYSSLEGDVLGLWMDILEFPLPPEWVEELVIFVGEDPSLSAGSFLYGDLPHTLRKITLVFQPRYNYWWNPAPGYGDQRPQNVWKDLAMARKGGVGLEVEIVGMELLYPEWLGVSVEKGIEGLREAIVDLDVEGGMDRYEAEIKAGRVQFYDKDIWAEREGERDFKRVIG